ncbi:MAG: hypothetical protein M2R45_00944 [Verrucomicrobia subdivision 3 bacterium]|nr:hypothetical protein [Limisphaerales bacterium]MCS1414613.1 hypothetical protein [Limisphaerales bacterium]
MKSVSKIPGEEHPTLKNASAHGCQWPVSYEFEIPSDWPNRLLRSFPQRQRRSGKFIQRNQRTARGIFFFIIRSSNPGRTSPILLQLTTNTYNAYN